VLIDSSWSESGASQVTKEEMWVGLQRRVLRVRTGDDGPGVGFVRRLVEVEVEMLRS
jgi:hypothetical protein